MLDQKVLGKTGGSDVPKQAAPRKGRTGGDSQRLGLLPSLIGYHLRRADAAFKANYARALEKTGIRQVLFAILEVVAAKPGIKQGEVGRLLGIQRPNMVTLINELVDRGLIERTVPEQDRRAFALSLTAEGQAIRKSCRELIKAHEEEMLADFHSAERQQLAALLARIPTEQS
jgi:DNA-binding MarR family transcriptional regulator